MITDTDSQKDAAAHQQMLHTPQPFLNLILNSLEGNHQMKDFLVDFLAEQINQIIKNLIVSRTFKTQD